MNQKGIHFIYSVNSLYSRMHKKSRDTYIKFMRYHHKISEVYDINCNLYKRFLEVETSQQINTILEFNAAFQ